MSENKIVHINIRFSVQYVIDYVAKTEPAPRSLCTLGTICTSSPVITLYSDDSSGFEEKRAIVRCMKYSSTGKHLEWIGRTPKTTDICLFFNLLTMIY